MIIPLTLKDHALAKWLVGEQSAQPDDQVIIVYSPKWVFRWPIDPDAYRSK